MDAEVYDGLYVHAEKHGCNRSRRRIVLSFRLLSYINFFLLPLMAASRALLPGTVGNAKDMIGRGNNPLTRGLFEAIFSPEGALPPWVRLPIGGSLVAAAARPAA